MFNLIACADKAYGIGLKGSIPWHIGSDMRLFKNITTLSLEPTKKNVVIMGRKTYESIPLKHRPLPDRINIILTNNKNYEVKEGVIVLNSVSAILNYIEDNKKSINKAFIIGGEEIYIEFLKRKIISNIYLTIIENKSFSCDTFFPKKHLKHYKLINQIPAEEGELSTTQRYYAYINKEELRYLNLMNKIMTKGELRADRTGQGSKSLFGQMVKYDCRNGRLPLITTRRMFLRGIIEELLFFISGKTNANILKEKGVHIWDGNTTREFLDSRGLNYEDGDMGPLYPFQLRHWNANYTNCEDDYEGKGFDQLSYVINEIKNNPSSRRILFSYWNPSALDQSVLPPCHILYNFHVNIEKNEIDLSFYQRSCDMFHGVGFNIASATILLNIICHITGKKPGWLYHHMGDHHVYLPHEEAVKLQLLRTPNVFPHIEITKKNNEEANINDYSYEDFKILNYHPYGPIKVNMIA